MLLAEKRLRNFIIRLPMHLYLPDNQGEDNCADSGSDDLLNRVAVDAEEDHGDQECDHTGMPDSTNNEDSICLDENVPPNEQGIWQGIKYCQLLISKLPSVKLHEIFNRLTYACGYD